MSHSVTASVVSVEPGPATSAGSSALKLMNRPSTRSEAIFLITFDGFGQTPLFQPESVQQHPHPLRGGGCLCFSEHFADMPEIVEGVVEHLADLTHCDALIRAHGRFSAVCLDQKA